MERANGMGRIMGRMTKLDRLCAAVVALGGSTNIMFRDASSPQGEYGVPTRYGRRHLAAATHVEVTVWCDDGVSVAGVVALGADGIDGVYQRLAAAGCRMND